MHRIKTGQTGNAGPGQTYRKLTDISGRCPPEDIGGPPGYEAFAEIMADPKRTEHNDLKEWYGGNFGPITPDADELRFQVLKLAKRWKPKKAVN